MDHLDPDALPVIAERNPACRFAAPAGCRFVRLALTYQRAMGTTRIEGYMILRRMELARTAQPPSGAGARSRVM